MTDDEAIRLSEALRHYVESRSAESHLIEPVRMGQIDELARATAKLLRDRGSADLLFICTHNSRRSHLAQVWAAVAARHRGIRGVSTFSGGTEITAVAPGTTASLRRCGFLVAGEGQGGNPIQVVRTHSDAEPMSCWSKRIGDAANPDRGFVAVMMCTAADIACPVVEGAAIRVALPHADPKTAEGSPGETLAYDRCCADIAREMLYLFDRVGCAARP